MTDQQIPQYLDPFKQLGSGLKFKGSVALKHLDRLEGLLANREGSVTISLNFFRDEQRIVVVEGELEAQISLVCQRCMSSDNLDVASHFRFALLRDEEKVDTLPESYEPLVLEKPEIDVFGLIEEELILALPIVHFHDEQCVEGKLHDGKFEAEGVKQENPFAVLKALKKESAE